MILVLGTLLFSVLWLTFQFLFSMSKRKWPCFLLIFTVRGTQLYLWLFVSLTGLIPLFFEYSDVLHTLSINLEVSHPSLFVHTCEVSLYFHLSFSEWQVLFAYLPAKMEFGTRLFYARARHKVKLECTAGAKFLGPKVNMYIRPWLFWVCPVGVNNPRWVLLYFHALSATLNCMINVIMFGQYTTLWAMAFIRLMPGCPECNYMRTASLTAQSDMDVEYIDCKTPSYQWMSWIWR